MFQNGRTTDRMTTLNVEVPAYKYAAPKNLDYDVDLVLPVKLLEVDLHVRPLYDHCSVKSLSWMRYNMSKSIVRYF